MSFRRNISRVLRVAIRVTVMVVTLALLIAWPVSYWRLGRLRVDHHSVLYELKKEVTAPFGPSKGVTAWFVHTMFDMTWFRGGIGFSLADELCDPKPYGYWGPGEWKWGASLELFSVWSTLDQRTAGNGQSQLLCEVSPYRDQNRWHDGAGWDGAPTGTKRWLVVPVWLVLLPLIPWSCWIVRGEARAFIARRRASKGLCAKCGYDLRASAGACPECGMAIVSSGEGASPRRVAGG